MLSGCAAVKRTTTPFERYASASESVGQHIICQRDDLVPGRRNVSMHVANEMPNPRSFGEVARMHNKDILVRGADDIGGFCVVVKDLSRMKNGSGWQFEREEDTIGRFDQPPHAAAILRAHPQLDNRQPGRRLRVRVQDADGNRSGGRCHE